MENQYGASICLRNWKNIAFFCKINFIDLALLYSFQIEKTFARKYFFWKIDLEQLYMLHFDWFLTIFRFLENWFGSTIVSPNWSPGEHFSVNVANFAKPLWNVRSGGAFLGPKEHILAIRGEKKLPQTLRFIRFERKWRPWTPRARKSSIWTTNSKPKLIFLKSRIFQKIALK